MRLYGIVHFIGSFVSVACVTEPYVEQHFFQVYLLDLFGTTYICYYANGLKLKARDNFTRSMCKCV